MPVTMGGLASGLDTDGIIEKLVQVEAQPIKQWSEDREKSNRRKDALEVLKQRLGDLNEAAKKLYGFRASYDDKKAISSNPAILEATANKAAEKGIQKLKVKELASTHKISTDKIKRDEELPSGKFTIKVNNESRTIKFRGGTLASLRDVITEEASEIVDSVYVKTDSDNYILSIESKIPGRKGEILLSGNKDFLKKTGLVKGEVGEKKETVSIIFDRKFFTAYAGDTKIEEDGTLDVSSDGNSLNINGTLWREYILPVSAEIKKDTVLEVEVNYVEEKVKEQEAIPYRVEIGPEEELTIKGIKLQGYNVPRIRPPEEQDDKKPVTNVAGIGVVSIENGRRVEKIYDREKDVKGRQVLPIGADFDGKKISNIIFYCNKGNVKFTRAGIITPVKGTGVLEPKNIVKNASDAKLELDGVEVVRDRNNNINDVIKGVNLTLKRSSEEPVTVKIEPDIEKAVDQLNVFVKSYNNYIDYNIKLTKTASVSKPGDFKKAKFDSGLFVGDMTLMRLENSLKRAIGESYPSMAKAPIKIISQTGISTGEINSSWEAIKEGKLIVDDMKLSETIEENPEGISEFFGSDTDGDNRIDNGMAYRIERILNPFLMSGRNIIVSKINLEKDQIKSVDDRIDRHKEHLKKYEDKLRAKFAAMEKSVSESKSQGNWLQMNLGGSGSDSKKK
ncbi:MAG: flagellar filament capping protein FliD [Spirochaetes bacterium]|nr:flagellar filament capping protein FliD [Spirochaetota bacterium]